MRFQPFRALSVTKLLFRLVMIASVYLYYKVGGKAYKVRYVLSYYMLSLERQTQLAAP